MTVPGLVELFETEHGLVEFRRLFQIVDLEREVHDARLGASLSQLVAPDLDDFLHAAVRPAIFQSPFLRIGKYLAAVGDNGLHRRLAVLNLDAKVMDAGTGAGEL